MLRFSVITLKTIKIWVTKYKPPTWIAKNNNEAISCRFNARLKVTVFLTEKFNFSYGTVLNKVTTTYVLSC